MDKAKMKAGLTESATEEMRAALLSMVAELPPYEMHLAYIFVKRLAAKEKSPT